MCDVHIVITAHDEEEVTRVDVEQFGVVCCELVSTAPERTLPCTGDESLSLLQTPADNTTVSTVTTVKKYPMILFISVLLND